jgi:para-nitrobenzyl esterase|tara:strand:+ start:10992 stop:12527 length:1536 start_codon:yes stop_codon:yes gene_type:complete
MINKAYKERSSCVKVNQKKLTVFSYMGINYAKSVQKKLRWSTSQPKPLDLKYINTVGFIAPQLKQENDLLADSSIEEQLAVADEQCLNLNIFTANKRGKLPVMVWIHGGGFQLGSGSLPSYEGTKLAQAGNVVVVSINYRLGALGFLRLCDISNGAIKSTGNEGLTDQVTALKWIKRNIGNYGGDKNNITIFGESAGAMSIACLLASPKAKGLFHKAILQSGASHTYSSIEKANNIAKEFINSANILGFTLKDLPTMTTEEILKVQTHFLTRPDIYQQFGMLPFCPVIEKELLPLPPHQAIKQGSATGIPILAGTNNDEWTFFAAMTGQNLKSQSSLELSLQVLMDRSLIPQCLTLANVALSKRKREITYQNSINEVLGEYWFTQPCHRLLANHHLSGGDNYRYKLGRKTIIETLGCSHITDIGFVFGHTTSAFHGTEARVNELINEVQASWAAFAHKGNPSTASIDWPSYEIDNKLSYVCFDHESTYLDVHDLNSVYFWSNISDQQLADF